MTDAPTAETPDAKHPAGDLVQEYELDAPPKKVWRAISIPDLREQWLPGQALADPAPASVTPGQEVRYRMREDAPPFLESVVTFQVVPSATGGTLLRIIHRCVDARLSGPTMEVANDTSMPVLLAA